MPEDQVKFAILKGMKNSLRKEIVNHAPTTVDEIRRWGCIAEAGEVGDKDSTSSTTANSHVETDTRQIGCIAGATNLCGTLYAQ